MNKVNERTIQEPKPEFVPPPQPVIIGHPRLGYKPISVKPDPCEKFNMILLFIFAICMIGLGMTIGIMLNNL